MTNATHARASILEYTGILRSKADGYARPGEESTDLGIEDDSTGSASRSRVSNLNDSEGKGVQDL